jgi:GT2 family glycosyltransferase
VTTAVIIPCAASGRPARLAALLQQQQPAPDTIVVVGRLPAGEPLPAGVQLLAADGLSAAAARNRGAAAVTADLLIFVDADVEPAAGWLAALTAAHAARPQALLSAVLELDGDSYWRRCDHRLAYAPILRGARQPPRWLPAMSLLVPQAVRQQLGGFDESYGGAAGEDIDYCRRARRAGIALGCVAAASIRHTAERHTRQALQQHQQRFGAVQRRLDAAAGRGRRWWSAAPLRWPAALLEAVWWHGRAAGGRPADLWGLLIGRLAWYRGYSSS